MPYGVGLELTARCNLDCIHCYHVICSGAEMSTEEITGLFDDLAQLGTMELTLTGGEPLLRSDFPEILRYAVEKSGFSIKIFSNLTLLTASLADLFASFPLNTIETTILGPDEAVHDRIAGCPGSFDALIKAIKMLKERNVPVAAKTIVMRSNMDGLDGMYRLADNLGIPFRHDDAVFVESDGSRKPLSQQISHKEILRLRKIMGMGEDASPMSCNAAKSVMSISPDGTVFPCGPFPKPAGNIFETRLADIWYESPLMKSVRSLTDDDYSVCRNCVYLLRCSGCAAMGIGLASGRKYPCRLARKLPGHLS